MGHLLQQADFIDRNNFADWLNRTERTGLAVEVGTHRGDFASLFLYNWKGKALYCVDPYTHYNDGDPASRGDRNDDYKVAYHKLARYGPRCLFCVETSAVASSRFSDESLDFVYLDGDHRSDAVRTDLNVWWPTLRSGGVLAGHDFLCHTPDRWHEFIQPEVFYFMTAKGLRDLWLVTEPTCQPWSFYLIKP